MTQGSVHPSVRVAFSERCRGGGSGIRQEHQVQTREGERAAITKRKVCVATHRNIMRFPTPLPSLAQRQPRVTAMPNWKWCQMCVKAYLQTFAAIALCDPLGRVSCAGDEHNY